MQGTYQSLIAAIGRALPLRRRPPRLNCDRIATLPRARLANDRTEGAITSGPARGAAGPVPPKTELFAKAEAEPLVSRQNLGDSAAMRDVRAREDGPTGRP